MSPLAYLLSTRIKNNVKQALRSPSKIIVVLLIAAFLIVSIFSHGVSQEERPDISQLYAMVFLLYSVMFVMLCSSGFSNGSTFFSMADVNMVFTSPISPKRIMFFGFVQQIGNSLVLSLFLVFQYNWLHDLYGIKIWHLIVIIIGFAITVFCGQLTAMTIYSSTKIDGKGRSALKAILIALCVGVALFLVYEISFSKLGTLTAALNAANSFYLNLFPVSGWLKALFVGVFEKNIFYIIAGILAVLIYISALVIILNKSKRNYYEDVLCATEKNDIAKKDAKEGKTKEFISENIKAKDIGIKKGSGASAVYFKSLAEMRHSKASVIDLVTLSFLAMTILLTFIFRGEQESGLITFLGFSAYSQMFGVVNGKWNKELEKPYIYLIPDKSYKKLFNCIRISLYSYVIDSCIASVAAMMLLKLTAAQTILLIITRLSFYLLFIAASFITQRIFGRVNVKSITMMVYAFISIILVLPGIITAASVFYVIESFDLLFFGALIVSNLVVSAICLALCANVFKYPKGN